MPLLIQSVAPGSPAQTAGLRPGMCLVSIGGHTLRDGLDYEFYSTGATLSLVAQDEAGAQHNLTVQKQEYQPLGCGFETFLASPQRACNNRCIFCFVDQLPRGLRPSLYFKDDDERLGFLFGNYITLTNLTPREVDRIIDMRFSPVNISVHTTNPALRCRMMGNASAGAVLDVIPKLAAAGIALNFQLVLVPGYNDDDELVRSIRDLAAFWPATQSIAAVPVGLTKHRQHLTPLRAFTPEEAARQLDILLAEGDALLQKNGTRLVYPSDEWFLLAHRPIPEEAFYEGYPQLENGVGMWRLLADEFADALANAATRPTPPAADIATGTLAAPLMRQLAGAAAQQYPGAVLPVHAVENHLLGTGITVAGLLCGGDIIAQLRGRLQTGRLLLPATCLRAEGDVLLDGTTPAQLEEALDASVQFVPTDGGALLNALWAAP